MKYTYKSQELALNYLIENSPHDMEKFRKLYEVETVEGRSAEIYVHNILFSNVWTTEEKVYLIRLYGHDKDRYFTYKDYSDDNDLDMDGCPLIDQCIKKKNLSGVEALLELGSHISVASIVRILKYVDNSEERYKFCEVLVNHYADQEKIKAYTGNGNQCYLTEIPSLCDRYARYSRYLGSPKSFYSTASSMEYICETNDLNLVKLFLPTVKDINPLFAYAVKSGNIEMVKMFIEAGADVNFQDKEFECDNGRKLFKTPLKIAIDNNDLEMVKFLYQNGANLNFVDKSEVMQGYVNNLGDDEEKETHQYKSDRDRHDYIIWTKTPLEYAINLGPASIINQDVINDTSNRKDDEIGKQYIDRALIVRYLYENGATFGDGKVDYNDLICFSINADDVDGAKLYFEEALKNNYKLDFVRIINTIHEPGRCEGYHGDIWYKSLLDSAIVWFKLCEEYSKKLDEANYENNIRLMLERIFKDFISKRNYKFEEYRDIIVDFTKILPKEMLKDIPAVFGVSFNNLEEALNLGYDINCINENGNSLFMDYISNRNVSVEVLDKLYSLGADPNYQNEKTGHNALSYALLRLPLYDFERFIRQFDSSTNSLYLKPEQYEKEIKSVVKKMIDLSSDEIIMSNGVKQIACFKIGPGYPQIIYNEILEVLSKRGFKVDDEYFAGSIKFLEEMYSLKYVTNPWGYLYNLYSKFDNKVIDANHYFPKIEDTEGYEFGTEDGEKLFSLIKEHLSRNFVTSTEQISEPNKVLKTKYKSTTGKFEDVTVLENAQEILLFEIKRYIGNLDYRYIIKLIDSFSIIDKTAIDSSSMLIKAIDVSEMELCKELINRGISIVCYDENGHDVTSNHYTSKQIDIFTALSEEYNPNKEYEDLLAEIGCGSKPLSRVRQI